MVHKKGPLYRIVALNLLGLTLKPQDKVAFLLGPKPHEKVLSAFLFLWPIGPYNFKTVHKQKE